MSGGKRAMIRQRENEIMSDKAIRARSMKVNVECPYCKFINFWYLDISIPYTQKEIVTCDSDEGDVIAILFLCIEL